jgi:hypothetical protein
MAIDPWILVFSKAAWDNDLGAFTLGQPARSVNGQTDFPFPKAEAHARICLDTTLPVGVQ